MTATSRDRSRRGEPRATGFVSLTREMRVRAAIRLASAGVLFAALPLGACAGRAPSPFSEPISQEGIRIEVRNDNYLDVTIYAMRDGLSQRLGDVTGSSSATLEIPPSLTVGAIGVRLLVSPIGSRQAYLSETISAGPGDTIELRVASVLRMSSWSLRR